MTSQIFLIYSILLGISFISKPSHGQELSDVEEAYFDYKRGDSIGFRSMPIDHMIPTSKTVVFALDAMQEDVRVISADMVDFDVMNNVEDSIEASGYQLQPFAGLSLKNVAFGLVADKGSQKYLIKNGYYSGPELDQFNGSENTSIIDYWGMGFNVYLNPFPKFKRVFWTFHLGARLLNATHAVKYESYSNGSKTYSIPDPTWEDEEFETVKYSITKTTIGSTFNIKLGKRARLIPWVNYSLVDVEDFAFVIGDTLEDSKVSNWSRFKNDGELFWSSQNPLNYGVDFSLKIYRFEIHFGDLLGAMYQSVLIKDKQIETDDGFSISFSYDFKAR